MTPAAHRRTGGQPRRCLSSRAGCAAQVHDQRFRARCQQPCDQRPARLFEIDRLACANADQQDAAECAAGAGEELHDSADLTLESRCLGRFARKRRVAVGKIRKLCFCHAILADGKGQIIGSFGTGGGETCAHENVFLGSGTGCFSRPAHPLWQSGFADMICSMAIPMR